MIDEDVIRCAVLIKKIADEYGYFSTKEHASEGKYLYVPYQTDEGVTTKRKLFRFSDFKEDIQNQAIEYARKYYGVRVIK